MDRKARAIVHHRRSAVRRSVGGGLEARWILIGLVALGAALRFYRLGAQSFWVDELLTIKAANIGGTLSVRDFFSNVQGPLHAALVHLTAKLSTSEAALRSLSAAAGVASIPAAYVLGTELVGRRAGLFAGLLMAVSPFDVWYSQELRNYALLILFSATSTLCAYRLATGRGGGNWAGYVVSAVLAVYCNLSGAFLAGAHALFGLRRALGDRSRIRRWLAAHAVVAALVAPLVWGVAVWAEEDDVGSRVSLVGAVGTEELLRGETTFTPMGIPYALYAMGYGYSLGPSLRALHVESPATAFARHLTVVAPAALLLGLGLLFGLRRMATSRESLELAMWVGLVPTGCVVVLAMINVKPFNVRYLSVVLPVLLVTLGAGVSLLRRTAATFLCAGIVLFSGVSLSNYFFRAEYWREDVREAARYVRAHERAGDVVLVPVVRDVFDFYYDGVLDRFVFYQGQAGSESAVAERIQREAEGAARLWLLASRLWQVDPEGRIREYLDANYVRLDEKRFPGVELTLYAPRPTAGSREG